VAAQPVTIIEDRVYLVGLVPILDCSYHYACDTRLSVLRSCYVLGESDIALGPDWVSVSGAVPCNNGPGFLDPPQSDIASLSEGRCWTPDVGETTLDSGMVVQ